MKVVGLAFRDGVWRIDLRDGTQVTARFAIDATGRAATLARSQGLRPVNVDRLVGCLVQFENAPDDGEGLMIEAGPNGWWYSAAIPNGRRVIVSMSDADLVRSQGIGRLDRWMEALAQTHHVRSTASGARPVGPPIVAPAGSRHVPGDTPLPLLRVGDAASSFDPVSGQGILKALRSGVFASYATADFLRCADESGIRRYRSLVKAEFSAYRQTLRDYYALERRWLHLPFWQRRHEGARPRPEQSVSTVPILAAARP
jgi:flavin-dependent dehydrogenase